LKGEPTCARGTSEKLRNHTTERIRARELPARAGYDKPLGSPGRGVRRSLSLGALRPEMVLELHPQLNGALFDPYRIGVRSGRKLCSQCQACGHVWDAAPHERSAGGGCPRCAREKRNASNRRVSQERSLAAKHPDRLAELHPSLNVGIDPYTLGAGSGQPVLVWWLCPRCGHEWSTSPQNRSRGRGCPRCGRRRTAAAVARSDSHVPDPHWHSSYIRPSTACSILSCSPLIQTASSGGSAQPAATSAGRRPTRGEPREAAPACRRK
jgi:predicted  nucleic acid-binding Zn-ribbon protein